MAYYSLRFCIFLLLFSISPWLLKSDDQIESNEERRVPALYIFGDSLVDCGNNVYLAKGKANPPYGVDFYGGKPTGRATNGKTVADYIALHLGLPLVHAYLGLSKSQKRKITTGINYASGSSGILPDSNNCQQGGRCLPFDRQISFYQRTVEDDLPKIFKKQTDLKKHLSKALFYVSIGVNDASNNLTMKMTPEAFDHFLLNQLSTRLQRLYNLGARKFLVNNIPPKGCFPANFIGKHERCPESTKEKPFYNRELPGMLQKLQSQLPGSTFAQSDYFKFFLELRAKATKLGITDILHPCCPENFSGTESCEPNSTFCRNRNTYLFFDAYHPTQIANYMYAKRCFYESSICTPLNLNKLMEA